MAKGPNYRRPLRRRVEGKTNYHKRLRLLKSRKLRCVIRVSSNNVVVQFVETKMGGDAVLISAHSKELEKKYGWNANTGNIPAAYLTGYLAGLRAKSKKIEYAILDLGLGLYRNRMLAAFRGVLDAEIEIPHRDNFFPEGLEERVTGVHIENYAKFLKDLDKEQYQEAFSGYLKKKKVNPLKLSDLVSKTKKTIESKI